VKPPRRVEREMEEGDGNRDGDALPAGPAGSAFGAASPRHPGDAVFASGRSELARDTGAASPITPKRVAGAPPHVIFAP
jgi:hypothetical protein